MCRAHLQYTEFNETLCLDPALFPLNGNGQLGQGRPLVQYSASPLDTSTGDLTQSVGYTPLLQEFPALTLDMLGVFPDYQHQIELKPGTVPVTCCPRPVPLALCDGVEKVVRELNWNGIWEPVEKSKWVL